MGKGVSLTLEELIELHDIIERKILLEEEEIKEFSDDEDEEVFEDYIDDDDIEEVEFEITHKGTQIIGQTKCLASVNFAIFRSIELCGQKVYNKV